MAKRRTNKRRRGGEGWGESAKESANKFMSSIGNLFSDFKNKIGLGSSTAAAPANSYSSSEQSFNPGQSQSGGKRRRRRKTRKNNKY